MSDTSVFDQPLVFGLDIGTRNVVGTVGYKTENEFVVVAQYMLEHETRAMLDGQIHDIGRVGHTIAKVKEELESQIGQELTEVCIAAAGRVLKTVDVYKRQVLMNGNTVNYRITSSLKKEIRIVDQPNPTEIMKAVKNPVEVENIRKAHVKDGVAFTKFMYWLKTNIGKIPMTEISVIGILPILVFSQYMNLVNATPSFTCALRIFSTSTGFLTAFMISVGFGWSTMRISFFRLLVMR